MQLSTNYEIVEVADEIIAIPVGSFAENNKDVFALSKAAGFLMKQLKEPKTREQLIHSILEEFDLDAETASKDVSVFLSEVMSNGLISE